MRTEGISIRGEDLDNPILLFLAGGPGGSQMAAVRHELPALESDFTVVNWDQPGSGKSYYAMPIEDLTPNVYIEDGIALAEYLCERFGQEAIYVVGESWGSALGVFMAAERPDLFHAFIGTGQMVDFLETELIDYDLALRLARQSGDAALEVPVYFLLGRHDINAPTALVEDYAQALDAPTKEIIWFEHSGHSPWVNESDRFARTVAEIAS